MKGSFITSMNKSKTKAGKHILNVPVDTCVGQTEKCELILQTLKSFELRVCSEVERLVHFI